MAMRPIATFFAVFAFVANVSADEVKTKKQELSYGNLKTEDWLKHAAKPLEKGEVDRLINQELKKAGITPTPLTNDAQFLRRAYLDLTGRLPVPADITEFEADKSPEKRAKVIDKLLDSPYYAEHWAQYWRNVIGSKLSDQRAFALSRKFEDWLSAELKANKSWAAITREILVAGGESRYAEVDKNGQAFFMMSRFGADANTEIAAETSRIFLGMQIQCAQCHDHPSDVWKRHHFHEFAAHFARRKEAPIFEEKRIIGYRIISLPFAEHRMPDRDDAKKTTMVHPKFLDGKNTAGKFASDEKRRSSLVDAMVSKDNPWFAAAFVNRIWGELMGQSFYMPIDDLGPGKDAVMPEVIARLAAGFRGSNYDIKQLFRDLMTSEAYQRQIRQGKFSEEHLAFASSQPVRLSADALWDTLNTTLGKIDQGNFFANMLKKGPAGPFARLNGFEANFKQEFAFDPSTKAEEIEASISQVLILMNNPMIQGKISAKGTNLLARVLSAYPNDDEALKMIYLRALARTPTDRERERCRTHIASVGNRAEAFEDILWALVNSAEYQTQR